MSESLKSWATRFLFNLFPCYRRTGVKVTYVSPDFQEVRIKLPLNWKTKGYNGTTFGGSMYACVDPVYMTMISWLLGKGYIAWDKSVQMDFRKPGRDTLYATFRLPDGELDRIKAELETVDRIDRTYDVELADKAGTVHALFKKTVQVRKRRPKDATA